ncbi:MAG: peptidylprolyl isomerase [Planctomycetota bacterium]
MLLGLLLPLAFPSLQEPRPSAQIAAGPFLRIEDQDVSLDEFGKWLLEVEGEHQAQEFAENFWVADREAKRLGILVEDEEVEAEVERQFQERIAGAFLGRREDWLAELERTGRTEEGVRRQRFVENRPEMQARAIAARDRVVPEHLIRREWELRHGRNGRRYDLAMMQFKVVVPSRADMSREEWKAGREAAMEEGRNRALAARERVLKGESFGIVASHASDDLDTREHRGKPSGGFSHVGWPVSFLDALEALAPGEISPPIYGRGGWWLVEVRSVDTTPLERVRNEIEADLVARGPEPYEIGLVHDRLREGLEVRILPALFEGPAGDEWPDSLEPVIQIDGEPVARAEYARWLLDAVGESSVDRFVTEWLLSKRAREAGVVADEALVAERTRETIEALVDRGYHGDRQAWIAYLELGGRSEESFVRRIARRSRIDLITEALFMRERTVRPEEVRARFTDSFGADGIRREVRIIVCTAQAPELRPGLSREELQELLEEASTAARRRAEALVSRLRSGEDFTALARAASDDPLTRDAGGAMRDRFRPDRWPANVAAAVTALAPLEITDPLQYGNQWFVFQLASMRRVAIEEVESELEREIRTARPAPIELAGYRNVLLKQARVEKQSMSGR